LILLSFSFFLSLFLFLRCVLRFFFTITSARRLRYSLSVTARPTKNNPQVGVRTPTVQKQKSDKKNETGLNETKKKITRDEYNIHTYICIDTRIDYEKDNYLIMSLLLFSSLYTFLLYFTSPILYSTITSPFLNAYFKIYDRQFFISMRYCISDSLHFEEAVYCIIMNKNPGYHYYYYYHQVFG
jgi:hypothetical protein